MSELAQESCFDVSSPTSNGLPLTGGHRAPKRIALGTTAKRWTSGGAAELDDRLLRNSPRLTIAIDE